MGDNFPSGMVFRPDDDPRLDTLPEPNILGWQALYQPGARAKCIKDMPPMCGFGRPLRIGDVVNVQAVCWRGKFEIAVTAECAFYELEGYFEVLLPTGSSYGS